MDIAAWTKESPKAGKWLSLSIKLKDADNFGRATKAEAEAF